MEKDTLNSTILKGFVWNFLSLVVHRLFDFIIKLVLARLLFPEQFGVVAMAAVFTSLIEVFTNLGFGAAIVQKKESELKDAHYHTAFWSGIVWSLFLYLLVYFIIAPLASDFYNEPILESIIPILSLGILSSPINAIQKAILTKDLRFKEIAIINNIAGLFSGCLALLLAYLGFGIWALVFNSVATFIIVMPLYFKVTKWLPKINWEKKAFKDIFGFGVYTTGTNLLSNISGNVDYLLVGRLISSSIVGAYSLGFMITSTFRSNLTTLINQIMFPVFGKLQDDKVALKEYYSRVTLYNCLLVFPFMGFFVVFSNSFILVFFGEKWVDAILPLFYLAIAQFFQTMSGSFSVVLRGIGRPGLEMKLQGFTTFLIFIPSIFIGTYYFGIIGTSISIIINQFLGLILAQYFLYKLINFSYLDLLKSIWKPSLITATVIFITFGLQSSLSLKYYFGYVLYFLLYGLMLLIFFSNEASKIFKMLKK